MTYAPEPTPVIPHEVSVAANSIGYTLTEAGYVDVPLEIVIAVAQRLYDQGLLAMPSVV